MKASFVWMLAMATDSQVDEVSQEATFSVQLPFDKVKHLPMQKCSVFLT